MKNKSYEMTLLFDFYGEMLTEKQQELFDLYYNEDFSLSEIAEHFEISRQGVRDGIVRAETILKEFESKLGLVSRYGKISSNLQAISDAADEIQTINANSYSNPDIDRLAKRIYQAASALND